MLNAAGLPVMPTDTPHRSGVRRRCRALQEGQRSAAGKARHLHPADQLSDRCQGQRSGCASPRRRIMTTI
ncbi:MAG: hypothetical protein MZV49_14660 [Rhodopseudomonas palustris]|nr:hypothetical protein [Rhodopseudomonas palustris]